VGDSVNARWRRAFLLVVLSALAALPLASQAQGSVWIPLLRAAPAPTPTATHSANPSRTPLPPCAPAAVPPCPCWPDLDCTDFGSQFEAQTCYEHCLKATGRDAHGLDRDNDGVACEMNAVVCATVGP
jgi:hypothetical protein